MTGAPTELEEEATLRPLARWGGGLVEAAAPTTIMESESMEGATTGVLNLPRACGC